MQGGERTVLIYRCIHDYEKAHQGSYWCALDNHFMFYEIICAKNVESKTIYLPPHILEKYFVKLEEK